METHSGHPVSHALSSPSGAAVEGPFGILPLHGLLSVSASPTEVLFLKLAFLMKAPPKEAL